MNFEQEFLIRLGATWLGAQLAVMGGTPGLKQHRPVKDFDSLGWAMLGCVDYSHEMRLMCQEALGRIGKGPATPTILRGLDEASRTR